MPDVRWKFEKSFDSHDMLTDFITNEKCWAKRSSMNLKSGLKTVYRCKLGTYKGGQCSAEIYVLKRIDYRQAYSDDKFVYELFRKMSSHNHSELQNKTIKVTQAIKEKIISSHLNRKYPKTIQYELQDDDNIPENEQPTIRQIRNIIDSFKSAEHGKNPITTNQLTEFAKT